MINFVLGGKYKKVCVYKASSKPKNVKSWIFLLPILNPFLGGES